MPAALTASLFGLLKIPANSDTARTPLLEFALHLWDNSAPIAVGLRAFLATAQLPISLGLVSYFAAIAIVGKCDREQRRRVRIDYLYLDGAFGLWPQMLVTGLGLLLSAVLINEESKAFVRSVVTESIPAVSHSWFAYVVAAILGMGGVWQMWLTLIRIPGRLLPYATGRPHWRMWWSYLWRTTIFAGIVYVGVGIAFDIVSVLAGLPADWVIERLGSSF
jgi:hypothetical protein